MTDQSLRAKAEAATPGPWFTAGLPWFRTGSGVLAGSPDPHAGYLIADTEMWDGERDEYLDNNPKGVPLASADADAAFIAAANPAAVLDLLDRLEAAERDAEADDADYKALENESEALIAAQRARAEQAEARLDSYRRLLDEAGKALEPFAEAMRKHDDPGVSDLYDEQPIGWAKLGDFRRARAVQASIRAATEPMEK